MFSGIKSIFTYLPALLLIILAGLSLHYYNQADEWHDKADAAAKERDEARFILSNQVRMVNIINDIAKANENDKQKIAQAGEARVVYIREPSRRLFIATLTPLLNHPNWTWPNAIITSYLGTL
ncbi:hypothetical protein [Yersinia proxima]|uniref:hypothetical protein n=1 Tax=Yersinia proxima TaxID=2890316 RepID=UPI001D112FE5|nr:hypothetical protein [Yersinia proxima]